MNDDHHTTSNLSNGAPAPGINQLLERMLGVVFKHQLLLGIVFLGTAGGGIFYTFKRPPTYKSNATIMLDQSQQTAGISSYVPLNPAVLQLQQQYFFLSILNSVVYKKRLAEALTGEGYKPPEGKTLDDVIDRHLDFNIQKNNMFVDIASNAQDAHSAWLLVDQAVQTFTQRSLEIEQEELNATLEFLDQQLQVVSDQIEKVEREIQEFQEANELDPGDIDRGVWGKLFDLERQRSETDIKIALERMNHDSFNKRFQRLVNETTQELGGKDSPQIQSHKSRIELLQNELERLMSEHPQSPRINTLQDALEAERGALLDAISLMQTSNPSLKQQRTKLLETLIAERTNSELSLVALNNQLKYLEESIRQFKENHPDLLESALVYARLTRSKEVYKNTFDIMLEKREETRVQAASETGGIKVIDPPYYPVEPEEAHAVLYIVISILMGVFLGTGVAYVLEVLDDSVKSAEEVRRVLNLSVLGYIPLIKPSDNSVPAKVSAPAAGGGGNDRNHRAHLLLNNFIPKDPVVEAYRTLKTNLIFAYPDEKLKLIAVSGPGVGEGKSLTSANLAISFAMSGQNTLLMDCDMRRPIQHKQFGKSRTPGLSDYLVGQAERDAIIQSTEIGGLELLPSGSTAPNPADLLDSERMKELLEWVKENYDVVIVDTPPVNLAVDARLVAKLTHGLVIVVQMEKTKVEAAQVCVEQVRQTRGKILGVVLNKIDIHSLYSHYYHYRYYNNYKYNYRYYNSKESG